MIKELTDYYNATNALAKKFLQEWYEDDTYRLDWGDAFWVGDDIGGVLAFGDYFINVNDLVDYFRCGYDSDLFLKYWDIQTEAESQNKPPPNMRSFKLLVN